MVSLHCSATHTMSKGVVDSITLVAGLGVEGDAHAGAKVQHLSRVERDPDQPNLRQVHLVHSELHDDLRGRGYEVAPGAMGENVTTRGIDLLGLPTGTKVALGSSALVEITGLRNPCQQLNGLQEGLMGAVLDRDDQGRLIRLAGIMGVVVEGGELLVGAEIAIELPPKPHHPLEPV